MPTKTSSKYIIDKENYSQQHDPTDCHVSKASKEIMLDRVCNGNKLEFPFCS